MSIISTASESAATQTMSTGSSLMSLLPMVLIFAIFYFFLLRPQIKKQRAVEGMVSSLKKGDKVIAAGGLYGVIHKIDGNIIYLEIAENTRIKALKSSVTELLNSASEEKAEESKAAVTEEKPKAAPKSKKVKKS